MATSDHGSQSGASSTIGEEESSPGLRHLKLALRVVVSVALLIAVVARIGDEALVASVRGALDRWWWLVVGLLVAPACGFTVSMLRLDALLGAHRIRIRRKEILRAQLMATFFNQLLPTSIGGDAHRIWYLSRQAGDVPAVLSAVFVSRVLGVMAMCLLVIGGSLAHPAWFVQVPALRVCVPTLVAVVLAACVALAVVKPPTIGQVDGCRGLRHKWLKLATALARYRTRPSALGVALGFSLMLQLEIVLQYWLFSWSLSSPVALDRLLLVVPMVTLAAMLPISLNGVGIREWVMIWICTPLGVHEADAAMMAMLFLVATLFYGLVGAVLFYRSSPVRSFPLQNHRDTVRRQWQTPFPRT